MKAIILAAGDGVRMRPLTNDAPKPLLKVRGRTLLDHLVEKLPAEVNHLVLVVRYLGEQIKSHCGENFHGRRVIYVDQPEKPYGTYAALAASRHLLQPGERFFVIYADDLIDGQCLKECLRHQRAIVVAHRQDASRFGVLQLNSDGSLRGIMEKPEEPPTDLVLTNSMLLDSNVFDFYPGVEANGEEYLTRAMEKMAASFPIQVVAAQKWLPLGYPEDLEKAEKEL